MSLNVHYCFKLHSQQSYRKVPVSFVMSTCVCNDAKTTEQILFFLIMTDIVTYDSISV
jgi:hypothetical protein